MKSVTAMEYITCCTLCLIIKAANYHIANVRKMVFRHCVQRFVYAPVGF